jgi:hypothetical protein
VAFVFLHFTCWVIITYAAIIIKAVEPIKLVVEVIKVGVEAINFVAVVIKSAAEVIILAP